MDDRIRARTGSKERAPSLLLLSTSHRGAADDCSHVPAPEVRGRRRRAFRPYERVLPGPTRRPPSPCGCRRPSPRGPPDSATAPTALLVPVDSLHALQLCCICRLRDAPVPVHHVRPDRGGRAGRCTCSSRCCYHARSARSTELMNQGLFITTCLMLAQFM
jgi:hypothetical protein